MKNLLTFLLLCLYTVSIQAQDNRRNWVRNSGNDKLALVIGNDKYPGRTLHYAVHDAQVIRDALQAQGYDVLEAYNLDLSNFKATIRDLYGQLNNYKTLVVFYAGHGAEIDGKNYLIPVDANPPAKIDVEDHCVNIDYLFTRIDNDQIPKIIILDACRDNPFAFTRSGADMSIKRIQQQKKNTKIIYSTAANTSVSDNNPFAEIFSRQIGIGGCIDQILRKTTAQVENQEPNQIIWEEGSLKQNICFGVSMTNPATTSTIGSTTRPDPIPEGMVFVEGGSFDMGCTSEQGDDCQDNEKPVHRVTLSDFLMGEHEVTVGEFKAFIDATGYQTTAEKYGNSWVYVDDAWKNKTDVTWRDDTAGRRRPYSDYNHPVINVSWYDAKAYCDWLTKTTRRTYRLPTETEWEYAARGGKYKEGYKYSGGGSLDSEGWYQGNSKKTTHPVKAKNANALGLYDMSGNVWEWCNDWYSDYTSNEQHNPTGLSNSSNRILRGGGWDYDDKSCRVSFRATNPTLRFSIYGFRVVAEIN